jgi:hypothetical protein
MPERHPHLAGKFPQQRVARLVAVGVVDVFEVVQIQHQHGKAVAIPLEALKFLIRLDQEMAPIIERGERIRGCLVLKTCLKDFTVRDVAREGKHGGLSLKFHQTGVDFHRNGAVRVDKQRLKDALLAFVQDCFQVVGHNLLPGWSDNGPYVLSH